MPVVSTPEAPWSASPEDVLAGLAADPETGLTTSEIERRQSVFGSNVLRRTERRSLLRILIAQLESFIVVLLLVGAALSFAFEQFVEGVSILIVIGLNTAIGFFTEVKAVRSMESLRQLGNVEATVRREGRTERVSAVDLVPGDIVVLEGGDIVTADLRILEASRLQADESTLTGESVPVGKSASVLPEDTPLGERKNMLFKGTSVTRGAGEAVVVGTGMKTELGHISDLVEAAREEATPLEVRLDRLGRALAWASIGFVTVVAIVGIVSGREIYLVVETAIALAVAAVPEGLPIVATIALARGMWRMARRHALIEELPAVETLGSTNVILTDKTGTLTENQMTVTRLVLADRDFEVTGVGLSRVGEIRAAGRAVTIDDEPLLGELLTMAALCTNATLTTTEEGEKGVGDPMEVAILVAAYKAGLEVESLGEVFPELREEAFDPEIKMMATYHRCGDEVRVAVKGAPEEVVDACTEVAHADGPRPLAADDRGSWKDRATSLGTGGLRTLAVATKRVPGPDAPPYCDLTLLGIIALVDPPKPHVREAIEACRQAGIRVVMVTGDQAATASNIGREVGLVASDDEARVVTGDEIQVALPKSAERARLLNATVIARTSPEQKLHLLSIFQDTGNVVAMLGDGVNDAPALHQADIGVAMGRRGTQVAREAAAMVLQDDELGTIAAAIEEGRIIFGNIRKFVIYLISCNLSEILSIGLATLVNAPLPILPLQILFLNLITDVFPALALGVGEGSASIMQRPPRDPDEPFLARAHWRRIVGYSFLLVVPVLTGLAIARGPLGMEVEGAVSVSFLILAFSQLAHVFNMSDDDSPLLINEVSRNRWVWGALILCTALILGGVYIAPVANVLSIRAPSSDGWLVVAVLAAFPLVAHKLTRWVRKRGRS